MSLPDYKRVLGGEIVDPRRSNSVTPRSAITSTNRGDPVFPTKPELSFRAHQDGAAHWALKIQLAKPIVITISQLDDRKDVSLVSLCLALMLLAFSEELETDVLAGA